MEAEGGEQSGRRGNRGGAQAQRQPGPTLGAVLCSWNGPSQVGRQGQVLAQGP